MSAPVSAIVFTGPTLAAHDGAAHLDAVFLPPAARGDVYRATLRRPRAIGIVDGYFEGVPSVWHKEILWAISSGIPVFGAASMGALRAAELHAFGMVGVGWVFEAFRDGRLEDDDEVAVVHGQAELGYLAVSEAMVNIRRTLAGAVAQAVVGPGTAARLEAIAKERFYKDRSYGDLLAVAATRDVPAAEITALRDWLPRGRVDQKRDDALEMLAAMRRALDEPADDAHGDFRFERTEMWEGLVAEVGAASHLPPGDEVSGVLEELRLDPGAYAAARRAALLRWLGLAEAARRGIEPGPGALRETRNRFRLEAGLLTRTALDGWLASNRLASADLERLLTDEARLRALDAGAPGAVENCLLDHLRVSGTIEPLAQRARAKTEALAGAGGKAPRQGGPTALALTAWYFETRLGEPIPDDLPAYAAGLGYRDLDDFYRALAREYLYAGR